MKRFTSLLIGCSLALAGAALAQQPEEQQSPPTEKHAGAKTLPVEAQPGANIAKPEATIVKQHAGRAGKREMNAEVTPNSAATGTEPNGAMPGDKHPGRNARGTNATTAPITTPAPAAVTTASAAPTVAAAGQQNAQINKGAKAKKPDPQQVQQIRSQHTSFHAQAKPQQVQTVTFNQSYRIEGSDHWQGPQYEVFRSYHPERHDEGWYHSHYRRVELVGGGYYYWNNGYWYPAWGYSPAAEYYVYDGPIYVGQRAEPPDQVIADVQSELQQMGYYKGEVDGLLGPLTRQALTDYQADQGLITTAVIDEPTLDALGMG